MQQLLYLIKGLGTNLLITLLSMIIPLGVGALLCFLARKKPTLATVFRWISLPFEVICPAVLLATLFYASGLRLPYAFVAVPALTVAYLGYMPARMEEGRSFPKTLLLGALGLFGAIFKWSFCLSIIGCSDALREALRMGAVTYEYALPLLTVLMLSAAVLLVVEVGKRLVRQMMR